MARKVRDVISPEPIAPPLDAPLTEAARLMRDQGIGGVLVTRGGRLCGLITDRDIVVRAVAEGRDLRGTRLGEVCSAGVVTIGPDDEADTAVRLMREQGVRRLPVVENGEAVGIVSIRDVAGADTARAGTGETDTGGMDAGDAGDTGSVPPGIAGVGPPGPWIAAGVGVRERAVGAPGAHRRPGDARHASGRAAGVRADRGVVADLRAAGRRRTLPRCPSPAPSRASRARSI